MIPIRLEPYLKPVLWGGSYLSYFKSDSRLPNNIGESWEVSAMPGCESVVASGPDAGMSLSEICRKYGADFLGREVFDKYNGEFPLLIKFIDAASDISIQVHPADGLALARHNSRGKAEMWYILNAEPGARMLLGFNRTLTPDTYRAHLEGGTLMNVLSEYPTSAGDVFYVPAGRVHAIGAGNFLVEIQQASDITYRLYDYDRLDKDGRPRQLHTAEAREAIDYAASDDSPTRFRSSAPRRWPHFQVCRCEIGPDNPVEVNNDSFTAVVCIGGSLEIVSAQGEIALGQGQAAIIPANTSSELKGEAVVLLIVP